MTRHPQVLCVGHASYDLIFSVPEHPGPDEKAVANQFLQCGGGPAANAAITVARQGIKSAFIGYLGRDNFGEMHLAELHADSVDCSNIIRGNSPTPISSVLVKPDGKRALVNYRGNTQYLPENTPIDIDYSQVKVMLFDGHEPLLSRQLIAQAKRHGIATVLDAGSFHQGTQELMPQVDYLIASEKFARQFSQQDNPKIALALLSKHAPMTCITLGEQGLIWHQIGEHSFHRLSAYPVTAIDSTGAGDVFHGSFAAGVVKGLPIDQNLQKSSAASALCCLKMGARTSIPNEIEINNLQSSTDPLLKSSAVLPIT